MSAGRRVGLRGARDACPWRARLGGRAFPWLLGCGLALVVAVAAVTGAEKTARSKMKIIVGTRVFTATLDRSETADAFRRLLPLTVEMRDVNRNEKAYDLPAHLPSADAAPRIIRVGDVMLWNSRTVVVFHESFATRYAYTRLGRIDDPSGLADALGKGDVVITFRPD